MERTAELRSLTNVYRIEIGPDGSERFLTNGQEDPGLDDAFKRALRREAGCAESLPMRTLSDEDRQVIERAKESGE